MAVGNNITESDSAADVVGSREREAMTQPGEAMKQPRTVAVVLTYRRPRLATESVRYLLEDEGFDPADVIVVVNGVGGLDDDELAASVRMVRLDSNLGPAGGMRAGLERATEDPTVGWVYLCEDDIGVSGMPGRRLDRVRELAAQHQDGTGRPVGAVVSYGRRLNRRNGLTTAHLPSPTDRGLIPTDVASWGATLVSRAVVDRGVLPSAPLFFGYEDFDFFLAIGAAGFDVLLDADCARELGSTVHPGGREKTLGQERSVDDTEPWRRYYEARNFIHLRRHHGHLGWTATHLVKSIRRGSMGGAPHRRAIVAGLWDGFRGRTGLNQRYVRREDADERPAEPGPEATR